MEFDQIFDGPVVSLQEMLDARSARAERQKKWLAEGAGCLISFTLNIPGEVKQFSLARAAFKEGLSILCDCFGQQIQREEAFCSPTGSEALLALAAPPSEVKKRTIAVEDTHPLGRLFDMDVLGADGMSLSREAFGAAPRRCFLCGKDARLCGRSRAHSVDALRLEVARLLTDHFRSRAADECASNATRALLYEVSATPKPGLVDRNNTGSHGDMDYFTFLDSSAALAPWFREMYCIGWDCAQESAETLFDRLRYAGIQAERSMFAATGGKNTHKGLIFSFSLLCGAMGAKRFFWKKDSDVDDVLALCAAMGRCALRDLENASGATNGELCYQKYRIEGIRGEAARGFPSARNIGLSALARGTEAGLSLNDASVLALLALLSEVTDTNMIRRGGLEKAEQCRREASRILRETPPALVTERLTLLDRQYIRENLSPGGCADLLAISLMLYFSINSPCQPAGDGGNGPSE